MLFKRTILIGGSVILVGALFLGPSIASYFRTTAQYVEDSVKNSIPIQFEIDRARQIVTDLEPAVKKHLHLIAKEEVQLKRLAQKINALEKQTKTEGSQILTLRSDLQSDKNVFRYASLSYTRDEVKQDLTNRFKRFKTRQASLEHLQKTYSIREKGLDAAREKLEGLLTMRNQLLLEIESLEMQKQMVDAAKVSSRYAFDDSELGKAKELIDELQVRLETESKLNNVSETLHSEIPIDAPCEEDIVDQVTSYFGLDKPDTETVATTE
ncbi:MAG: hypothetical protein PVH19_01790 [Planctomycetia bacterium]